MTSGDYSNSTYTSSLLTGPVTGGRRSKKASKALMRHTKKVKKAYRKFVQLANKKVGGVKCRADGSSDYVENGRDKCEPGETQKIETKRGNVGFKGNVTVNKPKSAKFEPEKIRMSPLRSPGSPADEIPEPGATEQTRSAKKYAKQGRDPLHVHDSSGFNGPHERQARAFTAALRSPNSGH
jgi:hypothetical protein